MYLVLKKDGEEGPDVKGGYPDALIVHASKMQKVSENGKFMGDSVNESLTIYMSLVIIIINFCTFPTDALKENGKCFALLLRRRCVNLSINCIVLRLVHTKNTNAYHISISDFGEAFITTFRTFITPLELIEKLTHRYTLFCCHNNDQKKKAAKESFSLLVRVVNDLT